MQLASRPHDLPELSLARRDRAGPRNKGTSRLGSSARSVDVCRACRKAHRKCFHGKGLAVFRANTTRPPVNQDDLYIHHSTLSPLDDSVIQFFIDHISVWFICEDTYATTAQRALWQIEVPRLAKVNLPINKALIALSLTFDDCPQQTAFKPQHRSILTSVLLTSTQEQIAKLLARSIDPACVPIIFLLVSMLCLTTIHGSGSLATLAIHMHGLVALCSHYTSELLATSAITKDIIMSGSQATDAGLTNNIWINSRHIILIMPLLRCISVEDSLFKPISYGSTAHLLLLVNRSIILWERVSGTTHANMDQSQSFSEDRSIAQILATYLFHSSGSAKISAHHSDKSYLHVVRRTFEHTIFLMLKYRVGMVSKRGSITEISNELEELELILNDANLNFPKHHFFWPVKILTDLRGLQQRRQWQQWQTKEEIDLLAQRHLPGTESDSSVPDDSGSIDRLSCEHYHDHLYGPFGLSGSSISLFDLLKVASYDTNLCTCMSNTCSATSDQTAVGE